MPTVRIPAEALAYEGSMGLDSIDYLLKRRRSKKPTCFLGAVSIGSLAAVRSKMAPPTNSGTAQTQYRESAACCAVGPG